MTARVVVTGAGVIAPNGTGGDAFWKSTVEGVSGIRPFTRFDPASYPVRLGGENLDFDEAANVPGRLAPQTDRTTKFAVATSAWALADAGLDLATLDEFEVGVLTANSCGGFEFGQRELQKLWSEGPHRVSAYQSFAWFYAVNTGQVSIRHRARGHSSVVVSEQAGGLDVLATARRQLRKGTLQVALAGATDAPLGPWGLTAQIPNGLLSTATRPEEGYRPFDRAANGYLPGEGGAMFVLECLDNAWRRGATDYGEIAGYAATFDPAPSTGRPPRLRAAIDAALTDAGTEPGEVDAVLADGAGTPAGDAVEAAAITAVFGPGAVPVAVPKTLTGRLYSGGAALDVFSALMMMRTGTIPAAANVRDVPAEYGLDLVCENRHLRVRTVLVLARGNGGFNSALVLKAP